MRRVRSRRAGPSPSRRRADTVLSHTCRSFSSRNASCIGIRWLRLQKMFCDSSEYSHFASINVLLNSYPW